MNNHLLDTYARLPCAFVRGEGAWLWDADGNRYLDALSGIGVCALGHANSDIAEVIADQARTLLHTANIAQIPWQDKLADQLAEISGLDKAFFCNSGAEAIECAIKIARLHGRTRELELPEILVFSSSFHGRTMACISASDNRKIQAGFEPLVGGFVRTQYGDLEAVRLIAERNPNIVAVLVEPVQGEGGVVVPGADFLPGLRSICDQRGWLLMADEIQSGLCRTGHWYACAGENVKPDIIATAKALGNGIPIGACLVSNEAAKLMSPGRHGSTFGGNPLACRVGSRCIEIMNEQQLCKRAATLGSRMLDKLRGELADYPQVVEVRGKGLMIGIEFDQPVAAIKQACMQRGLIINVTRDKVIRLLPPLIISDEEADQIIDTLLQVTLEFLGN